eukprot:gnl/MRDRNA2_/MRDRNA2_156609_c0_seq1.p1 gnl/MRDRNA2_/MRDRNA2_156609_c0~~gnl/MRDRNA2_/MRDRNA2_156609_c0_seq1.p1  ORF type:complete len:315 (+),score=47.22 gnl/MRDRNA2_/MRDRNA2_156609_c0_seq1:88-945(+)
MQHRIVQVAYEGATFWMAVYENTVDTADIVSNSIINQGMWDPQGVHVLHEALRNSSNFIDIGANVGWFTLLFAALGYTVWAVEPFHENLRLLKLSLCLNPQFKDRVHVVPYGLHVNSTTCTVFQHKTVNAGDTVTVCTESTSSDETTELESQGFQRLSAVPMRSLDDLFKSSVIPYPNGSIGAMKIDVEGFEPLAMRGLKTLLSSWQAPAFIRSEFFPCFILARTSYLKSNVDFASQYLYDLLDWGYCIATEDGVGNIIRSKLEVPSYLQKLGLHTTDIQMRRCA